MLTQHVHILKAFSALRARKFWDVSNTSVSKSVLYWLEAIPTFDTNIGCFCALCAPVSWHVRAPPKGLSTLRALVRVFSSVQSLMLQEFIAVNEALSTMCAFVCNSLLWRTIYRAGQHRILSTRWGSSAGGWSLVILHNVNIRDAVTAIATCCLFYGAAVQDVCSLLRWPLCILYLYVFCLVRKHLLGFYLVFECLCVRLHIFGVDLSQWRRDG